MMFLISVLSRPVSIGEMKTVGGVCRVRSKGLKIEAKGRQRDGPGGVLGKGASTSPPTGGSRGAL